ncbi:MAG TPA: PAS domain S-box protein [Tahibacter sp.]|uniref:PAS domain S-box protein n=1 Tax=Tahibacter sp. TaxID=2056211 RepID=UPI002C5572E7|nr:PAS domain S-box protein [Tahibacter sp.]HSX62685.1 PAS domain S-box protein [Tahibacter sp.]
MNAGIDIGLIGSAAMIRAASGLVRSSGRLLALGDLRTALRALPAVACDLLLVEAADPTSPDYADLGDIAPNTAWIALDHGDDVTRGRRWIEIGASAWLSLPTLDAATLQRVIAQTLALRAGVNAMRLQRDDLQAVFDYAPLPMWVYDRVTLRFLAVNDAAIRSYGWSREEFLRMTLYDIRPAEDHASLQNALSQRDTDFESTEVWRHRSADGRVFLVELTSRELRYAGREARLVMARDVTVERQAIKTIETSERRFRDLFEQSLGLICTHDFDGVLLSINPAAANALGYRVVELVGRSMLDVVPPPLHSHFLEYLRRIARHDADSGLFYIQHRDGSQRVWEYNNRVLHDEHGAPFVMGYALDITDRRLYEHRLREQQAELEAVNDASPIGLFRADLGGAFRYVNRAFERMSGQRSDEAAGEGWLAAVHPDDRERVADAWRTAVAARARFQSRHRLRPDSGQTVWVSALAAPLVVEGEMTGYTGSVEDVTARHLAEEQLRRNEQRLRTIADAMPAMIAYVDAGLRFQFANAAYEQVYGDERGRIVGRHARSVLDDATYRRREPYLKQALAGQRVVFEDEERRGGNYTCLEITYIPQWDDERRQVLGIHAMAQDITRKKVEEQRWIQAAEQDSLTGLANRAGFLVRLERALVRSRDQHSMLVVMYLDIDRFKQVNDTHGHAVGDTVLRIFAERLASVLRPSDIIGRLGGDEFTVIIEGMRRSQYAAAAAAKIVAAMRKPFVIPDHDLSLALSTSVGVAVAQNDAAMTAAELLSMADAALYETKSAGRDGYRVRMTENAA